MKEWHRTIILVGLILAALLVMWWSNQQYQTNFIETL